MEMDPQMWIAADFDCTNIPVDAADSGSHAGSANTQVDSNADSTSHAGSANEKLFVNKSVAIGYNIVKNPDYDNFKLEKEGYNKCFGEDC